MIVIRKELCPQNHPCPVLKICPVNAISQAGHAAPTVDNDKCICCCKCVKQCAVFTPIGCCEKGKDPRMF
jgi:dissimilatory sulfite reductase (desulfoviridin) alpha/beta subunit